MQVGYKFIVYAITSAPCDCFPLEKVGNTSATKSIYSPPSALFRLEKKSACSSTPIGLFRSSGLVCQLCVAPPLTSVYPIKGRVPADVVASCWPQCHQLEMSSVDPSLLPLHFEPSLLILEAGGEGVAAPATLFS